MGKLRSGMYVLAMSTAITVSDAPATALGRIVLAGAVDDDVPVMPDSLRVMPYTVLSVVVAGEGYFRTDGDQLPIVGPASTLIPPRLAHSYGTRSGERWTEVFGVFDGAVPAALAEAPGNLPVGPRGLPPDLGTTRLRAALALRPIAGDDARRQLLAVLDWVAESQESLQAPYSQLVSRAVAIMDSRAGSALDVREVATELGLGYDQFRRQFRRHSGEAPLAFYNRRRLEAAATLLRLTTLTLREIADELSYVDEFHLSRRFRAHFGVSPGRFRDR